MSKTIGELFDVSYGQKGYDSVDDLREGKTILISSAGQDSGCIGFFDIKPKFKKPFITVPRTGSVCEAFVQTHECCVNSNVLILIPKSDMRIESLFEVAYQIRLNKWRYTFHGRTVTPEKIKKQEIILDKIQINYAELCNKIKPKEISKRVLEKRKIKLVKITELCTIEKKNGISQNEINSEGNIPYVSSSSRDNGVVLFTGEQPNSKAKSLTIAKDGNDGCSFYQIHPFLTSSHNYVLRPKNNYPSVLLIYVGAVVRKRTYCYNHYYPLSKKHLELIEIPMPLNRRGEFDLDYIKQMIRNSYAYREIEKYL